MPIPERVQYFDFLTTASSFLTRPVGVLFLRLSLESPQSHQVPQLLVRQLDCLQPDHWLLVSHRQRLKGDYMVSGYRIYEILGVPNPFDPTNRWVTSPFFSSWTVAVVRLCTASSILFNLIFTLVWSCVVIHDSRQ